MNNWEKDVIGSLNESKLVLNPFHHIVIDNFFTDTQLKQFQSSWPANPDYCINTEFNKRAFYREQFKNDRNIQEQIKPLLEQPWLRELGRKFSDCILGKDLISDLSFENGGLHETFPQGYLGLHTDNLHHSVTGWRRILNLVVYLSPDLDEKVNQGSLQLFNAKTTESTSIEAKYNRAIMFLVDDYTVHGAPDTFCSSVNCPSRRSLALFYYVNEFGTQKLSTRTGWVRDDGTISAYSRND